jgi:hypothetical protein
MSTPGRHDVTDIMASGPVEMASGPVERSEAA